MRNTIHTGFRGALNVELKMRLLGSAMRLVGCAAVVIIGQVWRENGLSSKPAIAISSGTLSPCKRTANNALPLFHGY